jgi:hypothetical protein
LLIANKSTARDVHGDFHAKAEVDRTRCFPDHIELLSGENGVGETPLPIMWVTGKIRCQAIMNKGS